MWPKLLVVARLLSVISAFSTNAHDRTDRRRHRHDEVEVSFLADRVSSPERYAEAMNMTIEQVNERKARHIRALNELQLQLQQLKDGNDRHRLICEHRIRFGHHPFVCSKCWSYLPVCVCLHQAAHVQRKRRSSPLVIHPMLQVVVWFHHKEWGLTSNTGGLLQLALGEGNCKLLMKGLPEHDRQLQLDCLQQHPTDKQVVVLWPSNEGKNSDVSGTISLDEIRSELASSSTAHGREVVLLAIDGTWRNARRMVRRLPSHIPRLDLPTDVVSEYMQQHRHANEKSTSLLAPLRSQGPSQRKQGGESLVCTAEAVAIVLLELGMDPKDGEAILGLARTKVDLVRRYRGH